MVKDFVIDTNIILHDALSVQKFEDNNVIIPMTVIEELDNFKKNSDELGRSARHFSRLMDELREKGSLVEGVALGTGSLRIAFCREDAIKLLPSEMEKTLADNKILAVALFNKTYSPYPTVLITNDTNLRIKADALGIPAAAYENDKVELDTLYSGQTESIDGLFPNQFVVRDSGETIRRYDSDLEALVPLAENLEAWGLKPINAEQAMAMDVLLNDDIKLVTLTGGPGCGKTLLALAAALRKVTDEFVYKKLLVSRPVFPMGKDIGYLPGDINDKLAPYMAPIHDNVEFLMSGYVPPKTKIPKPTKKMTKAEREAYYDLAEKDEGRLLKGYQELVAAGIMEVEPLLYIRGRSIPDQIMIVDEVQNLSKHELTTIITRAGHNTKFILTGDIGQIDNPYLDATSNGLTYVIEKFKSQKIAAHVTLTQCERSELAEIAASIL